MTNGSFHGRFAILSGMAVAALYLGTLACCREGVIADGYDGVGFVLALDRFDLARFQPQPPGYPLLVLAGRLLRGFGLSPGMALAGVNALCLAAGMGALAGFLRGTVGSWATLIFLLIGPTAPLTYGLALATLSDAAALGVLLLFAVALLRFRYGLAGVLAGLCLGVRPPILPLVVVVAALIFLAPLRQETEKGKKLFRFLAALSATTLLWLLPLAWLVGAARLLHLTLRHAQGHFTDFGGSALLEPSLLERVGAFFIGIYQGGLGRLGWLLLPVVFFGALSQPHLRIGSLAWLGYAAWVLLMFPVATHGRHLLPLIVGLGTLTSVGLARVVHAPRAQLFCTALVILIAIDNGRVAWAFRRTPPPGAELAHRFEAEHPHELLYGTRAARYLDLYRGSGAAHPAAYLGEVTADLERKNDPPAEVFVTSEVIPSERARSRLRRLGRFCYRSDVPGVLRLERAPTRRLRTESERDSDGDCVELLAYRVRP